jgi:hypothetical protein
MVDKKLQYFLFTHMLVFETRLLPVYKKLQVDSRTLPKRLADKTYRTVNE